jgi:hypothetical protein
VLAVPTAAAAAAAAVAAHMLRQIPTHSNPACTS